MIVLALNFDQRLVARIAQHLACIEFEKIDRFSGVAVGFRPGLRHFVNHPGREFMFALAHQRGGAKQQFGALSAAGTLRHVLKVSAAASTALLASSLVAL